ncbi:MAG: nidogen-like domain-containing protein, partial [Planctomycetota bacterium]
MTLLTLCLAASLQAAPAPQAAAPKKPARPTAALAGARGSCAQFPSNLCVPLDSSFTVVPFGAQFGISFGACERNDDGSALLALNGWSFDFYGTLWQDLWVNNNGNVSLGTQFAAFSSSGFPVSGFPMVAAFWGDVDTRAGDGTDGAVWYREWSTAAGDSVNRLVVTWDRVAFYDENTSKLNTFQIIITDGNDPLIGLGNNVCFCYDDMEWTTGDASSGSGGLGGTPATVGANQGNGTDFFLVGRFDADGDAYDGPAGANDGVDYLDGRTISFSVGGATTNVAPVYVSGDARYDVLVGDTLTFDVEAIGPEPSQSVTLTVDAGGLANFSSVETSGGLATSTATFTPDLSQLGTHVVEFTATDDGSPVATSLLTVEIVVAPAATVGDELCTPNGINSTGRAATLYAMNWSRTPVDWDTAIRPST